MALKSVEPLIESLTKKQDEFDKADIDFFDADYRRSYGDKDARGEIHKFMRANPTAQPKDIKAKYPSADDDLINDALDEIEVVKSFAGAPLSEPEYYYRGIRYAPNKDEEKKLKQQTFDKANSKLPF